MKQTTKQQDMNRIRTEGPRVTDFNDDRPRVRRAALVLMALSPDVDERQYAIKKASADPSDAVYLSTMRAYLLGGAQALMNHPGATLE
jgi:hypothetical protein